MINTNFKKSLVLQLFVSLFLILQLCISIKAHANNQTNNDTQLTTEEKLYGLSQFWKESSNHFAFFDQVPELDFDKAYQNFIPKILATTNTFEYYRTLSQFSALLKDGHTQIYLPKGLAKNYVDFPPIRLGEAQHQAVIWSVSKELASRIPLGSIVLKVDDIPVEEKLRKQVFPYICSGTERILWDKGIKGSKAGGYGLLAGSPRSVMKLTFRTPSNEIKEVQVIRNSNITKQGRIVYLLDHKTGHMATLAQLDDESQWQYEYLFPVQGIPMINAEASSQFTF